MNLVEHLKNQEYPGRFITVGRSNGQPMVIYGAMGRSDASLARRYVQKGDSVYAVSTNQAATAQGNPELLTYRAVRTVGNDTLVANARHIEKANPKDLSLSLAGETYEPDTNRTPRITAALYYNRASKVEAALQIIRSRFDGSTSREERYVSLEEGTGRYVATYDGKDIRPAPTFFGEPVKVEMNFENAQDAARQVYDALAPKQGEKDYRVGVVVVALKEQGRREIAVLNKNSTNL